MAKEKRNLTFSYLQALLIIMVIDDHMSTRVGFFNAFFPYNSFYMPLFVFISGYFFRMRPFKEALKNRVTKILIPYLLWSLVSLVIALILGRFTALSWYKPLNFQNILSLFIFEPLSSINGPGWFAIMLFYVSLIYALLALLLNRLSGSGIKDYMTLFVLVALGMASVYICLHDLPKDTTLVSLLRAAFYLQFYHFGVMFRKYWESSVKQWNTLYVCLLCILVNLILILTFGPEINYPATSGMSRFATWYLPVVTFMTGGLFWYKALSYLSEKLGSIPLVDFISRNTYTIMMCHLLFANIPNFYVYFCIRKGSLRFPDFNITAFQKSAWYRYSSDTRLAGFILGLLLSLLTAFLLTYLKKRIRKSPKKAAQ